MYETSFIYTAVTVSYLTDGRKLKGWVKFTLKLNLYN